MASPPSCATLSIMVPDFALLDVNPRSITGGRHVSPRHHLGKVSAWPEEDQVELAEVAREIEARRTGVYTLSDSERAAIAEARRGDFASDDEAAAFWKRHGVRSLAPE